MTTVQLHYWFASLSIWLIFVGLAFSVFVLRTFLFQGGLLLWVTQAKFALSHRVYRIQFEKNQFKRELIATLKGLFLDSLLFASIYLSNSAPIGPYRLGLGWSFVVFYFWWETWFYFSHRLLHHPKIFFIHEQHHIAKVASPLSVFSFSIIERCILIFGGIGLPLALRKWVVFSSGGIYCYLCLNYILNLIGHSNVEFIPPGWWLRRPWGGIFVNATYHSLHHSRLNGHYGLFTPFLDYFFKTRFRDYEVIHQRTYYGQSLNSLSEGVTISYECNEEKT